MKPATFKTRWSKFTGKNSFCFQKHVAKDAELFEFDAEGKAPPSSRGNGIADVWKKLHGLGIQWPGEDLEKAYKQLRGWITHTKS